MYSAVHPAQSDIFRTKIVCGRKMRLLEILKFCDWWDGAGAVIEAVQCFIGILFPRHFKYSIHTQPSLLQGLDISNKYTYIPTTQPSAKTSLKLMTNLKFALVCGSLEMP